MAGYFEILCGITAIIMLLYYYFTANFDFWKVRNVPGPRPVPVFGNIGQVMLAKKGMGHYLKELYDEYKGEPLIGIFGRRTPILVVNDSDLIKDVLIKDFSKFSDRGMPVQEKADPLSQHLFNLKPDHWRPMRLRLSPIFTTGKLKGMFTLILGCSKHLEAYLEKVADKGEPVECRELAAKFTTDVIGSCAFGIEMNALADEDSEFRRMGRKVFAPTILSILRFRMRQAMPWLYALIASVTPATEVTRFFTKLITDTMQYRKENSISRNDFIDLLIDLQQHPEKIPMAMTDGLLTAQAFVFFLAGFETSSTTISHALYELAQHHDVQDKLRKEIKEFYEKSGGELTYEIVKEMPYLDKVFQETLRKYPPGTLLMRQSVEPYRFEGTKVSVPKDQKILIPVYAIHHDPNIYPKPDVFDPERFSPEVASTRHPMSFLPFGDGPRNCIGARFAVFQTKIGLITILRNYKVDVCEKTVIPYQVDPRAFVLAPKGGIILKLSKLEVN